MINAITCGGQNIHEGLEKVTPSHSSSLKRGKDDEEEGDTKGTKRESNCGRSRTEKTLIAAETQSVLNSPARIEKLHHHEG